MAKGPPPPKPPPAKLQAPTMFGGATRSPPITPTQAAAVRMQRLADLTDALAAIRRDERPVKVDVHSMFGHALTKLQAFFPRKSAASCDWHWVEIDADLIAAAIARQIEREEARP